MIQGWYFFCLGESGLLNWLGVLEGIDCIAALQGLAPFTAGQLKSALSLSSAEGPGQAAFSGMFGSCMH